MQVVLGNSSTTELKLGGNPPGRETKVRLLKVFSLAALAAVAAMALIGASSASAKSSTQLCKVHEEPCKAGNQPTSLHMEGVAFLELSMKILGVEVVVSCAGSLARASLLGLGTAPTAQVAHLEELTWILCIRQSNLAPCTLTTTKKGLFDILKQALNLATVTSLGTSVRVECPALPTCTFGGEFVSTLEGAGHSVLGIFGRININTALKVEGGGLCPATATLKASYESLEKIYVVS